MPSSWAIAPAWSALAVALCLGCSSAKAGESCPSVSPCGGDVAGTWVVDSWCVAIDPPFAEPQCQGAVQHSQATASGTVTFAPSQGNPATGTEQVSYRYSFSIDEVFSADCLKAMGSGPASAATCTAFESYFGGAYAVNCAASAGGCACTFSDQNTLDQSAPYTIQGQQIVVDSVPSDFCRSGSSLAEGSTTTYGTSAMQMHLMAP